MGIASTRLTIAAMAPVVLAVPTTQQPSPPAEGVVAPDFTCEASNGASLSWSDFEGKPVLVFFHAPSLALSARILGEVLEGLAAESATRSRLELLLVSSEAARVEELEQLLEVRGVAGRVVADPERSAFAGFRVISFPSAFCVAPDRRIVSIAKGAGATLAYRILLGCRLACGLLDAERYGELLSGGATRPADAATLRASRHLNMARRLLVAGRVGEAVRPLLEAEAADGESARVLAALGLVLLELDREAEARRRVERLAALAPKGGEHHLLRARLAIRAGELEVARAELARVDARSPEARVLRGMLLEAEGSWEAAAKLHRRTLQSFLWRERIPERGAAVVGDRTQDE